MGNSMLDFIEQNGWARVSEDSVGSTMKGLRTPRGGIVDIDGSYVHFSRDIGTALPYGGPSNTVHVWYSEDKDSFLFAIVSPKAAITGDTKVDAMDGVLGKAFVAGLNRKEHKPTEETMAAARRRSYDFMTVPCFQGLRSKPSELTL